MINIGIGLMILAGMVLMVVVTVAQQSALKDKVKTQADATRSANRILQAHVDQSETVRIMGLQRDSLNRWGKPNALALSTYIGSEDTGTIYGGIARFLRFSLQAAVLGYGAFLAIEGQVSSVVVFAAMMVAGRALAPLDGLVGSWSALINAWNAHKRIKDSLTGFYMLPEKTLLPDPTGEISVRNLVFGTRGSQEAIVKRISFDVKAGETIAVIGPSGAGKSTLLRLLAGGLRPSSGSIRLDGAELSNWNSLQLGKFVGYVPQAVDFLPGTVAQNIARFGEDMTDTEVIGAAQEAGIHDMIQRFPQGYDTVIGKDAFMPSGGQKQLLALARAFYRQPKLLFLDEPNANLDPEGDATLIQALRRANARDATVIIVTQRPNLLQVADKVLLLKNGLIENFGPASEIRPQVVRTEKVAQNPATNDRRLLNNETPIARAEGATGGP
jgi:PrtD family type I secretion system ABC transporter